MKLDSLIFRSTNYISKLLRSFRDNTYSENPWQKKQNEFMLACLTKGGFKVRGVLHVGGHFGEEYPIYRRAGAEQIIFFEPMPEYFAELKRRLGSHKDVVLVNKALGSSREIREMHINKGSGESTSFMKPTSLYDGYFQEKTVRFEIVTLDDFMSTRSDLAQFNLLVTDTQGFDLEVLKGAKSTLEAVDYVYTEVSRGHYCGEPTIGEIDEFLAELGFRRAEISMYGNWKGGDEWGDVFYVKQSRGRYF